MGQTEQRVGFYIEVSGANRKRTPRKAHFCGGVARIAFTTNRQGNIKNKQDREA